MSAAIIGRMDVPSVVTDEIVALFGRTFIIDHPGTWTAALANVWHVAFDLLFIRRRIFFTTLVCKSDVFDVAVDHA